MGLTVKRPGLTQGATDFNSWYAAAGNGTLYTGDFLAFTTASSQFAGNGAALAGNVWVFVATQDVWLSQGANPTAAKAAGSRFVKAGYEVVIDGAQGAKLAVLGDSVSGNACLFAVSA